MPPSSTAPGLSGKKNKKPSKLIYRIKNGLLYTITDSSDWQQVKFFPVNNLNPHDTCPDRNLVILQSTCSPLTATGYAQYMQSENCNTSVHLCIDTDGTVVQMVEFHVDARHAGAGRYAGYTDLDHVSIGIALVNPGPLVQRVDGGFATWWGNRVSDADVVLAAHPNDPHQIPAGWIPYTAPQISALMAITSLLYRHYSDIWVCVGLDTVEPLHASTPGHSLNKIFCQTINASRPAPDWLTHERTAGHSAPGSESDIIVWLNKHTPVSVLRHQSNWVLVQTLDNQEVWVHRDGLTTNKQHGIR